MYWAGTVKGTVWTAKIRRRAGRGEATIGSYSSERVRGKTIRIIGRLKRNGMFSPSVFEFRLLATSLRHDVSLVQCGVAANVDRQRSLTIGRKILGIFCGSATPRPGVVTGLAVAGQDAYCLL